MPKLFLMELGVYEGTDLSRFRTFNRAVNFCAVKTPCGAVRALALAKQKKLNPFVLGGGSNVFFELKNVRAFVIKNCLEESIEDLGDGRFRVSSSTPMMALLRFALTRGLDAPYYLASAPCQVGGAIAMNAGSGPKEGLAVFDFVESVEFADDTRIISKTKAEISYSYRHTEFLEGAPRFIISAILRLPQKTYDEDPIRKRLAWAAEHQDLRTHNCGSLCFKYDARLMKLARFIFKRMPAGMSQKKLNWAVNKSDNPLWLKFFILTLKALHKVCLKPLGFELRIIK